MTANELQDKIQELDERIRATLTGPQTRGSRAVNDKCQALKRKYKAQLRDLLEKEFPHCSILL
jgi:gluconate kinase